MFDIRSALGSFVQTPCGPRKSGMPDSVEMPAPVSATMRAAPATSCRAVESGSVTIDIMQRGSERIVVFLPWDSIETGAQKQILNTARMPFVFRHVAVMPDCHYGKGATVGTVLATKDAVIPAAVGVDIGCGMIAVRTPLPRSDIPDTAAIRAGIERRIPMSAGRNNARLT